MIHLRALLLPLFLQSDRCCSQHSLYSLLPRLHLGCIPLHKHRSPHLRASRILVSSTYHLLIAQEVIQPLVLRYHRPQLRRRFNPILCFLGPTDVDIVENLGTTSAPAKVENRYLLFHFSTSTERGFARFVDARAMMPALVNGMEEIRCREGLGISHIPTSLHMILAHHAPLLLAHLPLKSSPSHQFMTTSQLSVVEIFDSSLLRTTW